MKEAGIETNLAEEEESPENLIVQLGELYERIRKRFRYGTGQVEPGSWEREGLEASEEDVIGEEESSLAVTQLSEADEDSEEGLRTGKSLAFQLPVELSPAELVGKRLWRKQIARLGSTINHDKAPGGALEYTQDFLQKVVDNYRARAFPAVYATLGHSTDAKDCNGVAKDMFLKTDGPPEERGVYADFALGPDAEKVIESNDGQMGSSVAIHPDYFRRADKKSFGPSVQHVALVPRPYDPSLQGSWVPVSLSEETEVVDLTEAEVTDLDKRKEADSVSEVQTPEIEQEEVKVAEATPAVVSLEEFNALKEELEVKLAEERKAREATALELEEQRVSKRLETEFSKVIPAFRDEVKHIILSDAKGTEIQLSEGEGTESLNDRMWRILTMVRDSSNQGKELTFELGEVTRGDVEPTTGDSEADIDKRVKVLMAEKDLGYEKALNLALAEVSA